MCFPLEASQYELLYLVDQDIHSKTYAAKCKTNYEMVTVREISIDRFDMELIAKEMRNWATVHHTNAIKYYGSFMNGASLWVLSEFMGNGSLQALMSFSYPRGFRDESVVATIAKSVLEFLVYYHSQKRIHRNIQISNIYLGEDGRVAVLGFGLSTGLIQEGRMVAARYTKLGVTGYTAPEVLGDKGYRENIDIWGLGILMIEMVCGDHPYADMSEMEIMQHLLTLPAPAVGNGFSYNLKDFVKQCLQKDPKKRPSAESLLKHRFIKKMAKDESYLQNQVLSILPDLQTRMEQVFGTTTPQSSEDEIEISTPVMGFEVSRRTPLRRGINTTQSLGRFNITSVTHPPIITHNDDDYLLDMRVKLDSRASRLSDLIFDE